jgi:hypothetical protein
LGIATGGDHPLHRVAALGLRQKPNRPAHGKPLENNSLNVGNFGDRVVFAQGRRKLADMNDQCGYASNRSPTAERILQIKTWKCHIFLQSFFV